MSFSPPKASAGKNFMIVTPRASACSISVGVMTPGMNGSPSRPASFTTSGFRPGATPKATPASLARRRFSTPRTVPAPSMSAGRSRAIRAITSPAAAVRKVISATGRPPSIRASASGSAASTESMAITGTTTCFISARKTSVARARISSSLFTSLLL